MWIKTKFFSSPPHLVVDISSTEKAIIDYGSIGIIAGSGSFPLQFAIQAKSKGCKIYVIAHQGETAKEIEKLADSVVWIRLGQLGKVINFFKSSAVRYVVMAGGISRVKHFGDIKLDLKGASLIARVRSTKDDVVMRGIADELLKEKIEVVSCLSFFGEHVVREGIISGTKLSKDEQEDVRVGINAIHAMSSQDIGQLVVVKEGVVVAVEAVEGTDETIRRGGKLGGAKTVVVKFSKPTQDLRFDVPTIGINTIQTLIDAKSRVLALEAGKGMILDLEQVKKLASQAGITIIGTKWN